MANVGNAVLDNKFFPSSWTESNIILIQKPEKDPLNPGSYRPIALLNTDAKILTKLLSSRLQKIIPLYIHPDQMGFIPNRQLADNIHRTLNLIVHCKLHKLKSVALSIDLEKAFDSVNVAYLKLVLEKMQFGPKFLNTITAIYRNPSAILRVNNLSSDPISLEQGTRQGCPLSPLIFALAIESLAAHIRSHTEVSGIQIGSEIHKLGYMRMILSYTISDIKSSLHKIQTIFKEFVLISGLKVNFAKSEVFPMHLPLSEQISLAKVFPFKWTKTSWKYLGIHFPLNLDALKEVNYQPLVKSIRKAFKDRNSQKFSWPDRLQIIKSFILPRFLFLFRTLPIEICKGAPQLAEIV